jgi:hypothetical protein
MFTFLNTIILSALGLSLIPVLIHLLNRKKSKLVVFSSLDFLKSLQKKKMKKVKIQQILLLILRTAVLLLAVMAFARPVSRIQQQSTIDSHTKTSVVIVIDNSVATSYLSEKGRILDDIKLMAEQILNYLKEGDEALIITSAATSPGHNTFTQNFTELKAQTKELDFVYTRSNINEALYFAHKTFESARNVNREIYVLTPFFSASFSDEKITQLDGARLIFVDCSTKSFNNVGIQSVQILSKILEVNKPVEIRAVVKNFSKDRVHDLMFSVYLGGKRVGQSSLTINGEDETIVDMKVTSSKTGFLQGSIEIDDDAFTADNKRFFHLFIPPQIKVLLAGKNVRDTEFIRLAINPQSLSGVPIHVKTVTGKQLAIENLNDFDVVILSNIPRLDEALIRRTDAFLASGKGLLLIPGSEADVTTYNAFLSKNGFGKIMGIIDHSAKSDVVTRFGRVDFSHPIISGIYDQKVDERSMESPDFIKFFITERTGPSQTLIAYSNNTSFMEETSIKNYNALFITSATDLAWSNWPIKGLFVPLINRTVNYLYFKNYDGEKIYTTGKPVEIRLTSTSGDEIVVKDPNGVELIPKLKQLGEDLLASIPLAELPGTYNLSQRGEIKSMFDVNIDGGDIVFERISKKKLNELFPTGDYLIAEAGDSIENIILQSRYGTELWKWLIFGVLLLLVAEIFISQSHRILKN